MLKFGAQIRLNARLTDFLVVHKRLAMHKVIHKLPATQALHARARFDGRVASSQAWPGHGRVWLENMSQANRRQRAKSQGKVASENPDVDSFPRPPRPHCRAWAH